MDKNQNIASEGGSFAQPRKGWFAVGNIAVMLSQAWLVGFTLTAIAPALPMIAARYGGSCGLDGPLVAQLIMVMPSIGIVMGSVPGGYLVERFGVRSVLILALIVYLVAGIAPIFGSSFEAVLGLRLVLGVAAATIATAITENIARCLTGERRARIFSYSAGVGSGVGSLSLLAAGRLAEAEGWASVFVLYAAAAPVLLLALLCVPRYPSTAPKARVNVPTWDLTGGVSIARFLGAIFFSTITFMITSQVPFVLAEDNLGGAVVISYVVFASAVATTIGSIGYAFLRALMGEAGVFKLLVGFLGVGCLFIGLGSTAVETAVGCALTGLGGGMLGPHFFVALIERATASARGRAIGFLQACFFLGDFLNPLIVVPMRAAVGSRGAFLLVGFAVSLGLVLWILAGRLFSVTDGDRKER